MNFRKLFFYGFVTLFILFFSLIQHAFSQTIKLASNLFSKEVIVKEKEYIVNSVAYLSFVEDRQNELRIEAFLKKRGMPLYKNAAKFIEVANKYNLDPFFLPAIAITESSGGLAGTRATKNNNPFGWGSKRIKFESFDQAIDTIGYKLTNLAWFKDKSLRDKLSVYNQEDPKYKSKIFGYMRSLSNQKIDSVDYSQYLDSFKIEKVDTLKINVIQDLSL